jgi:hypothetical protein
MISDAFPESAPLRQCPAHESDESLRETAARGSETTADKRQSTICGETARAASCTSGVALKASGVPLPNRRRATS